MNRKIAVLTVGRSDFGRYHPVLRALRDYADVALRVLATGAHFSPAFGNSVSEIIDAGFAMEPGLEMSLASDSPASVGKAIGLGTLSLAQAFAVDRPDLLVVLGDRYEMLAGPMAALGFNIPVVHLHGGAVTEGAIDEQVRHALTKMSHLHLVSTEEYARRVRQMGEEPWRVINVGAPGLDDLAAHGRLDLATMSARVGLDLSGGFLLVSFHPVTLELDSLPTQLAALLDALDELGRPVVLTYPNTDPGHHQVIAAIEAFAAARSWAVTVRNAGTELYTSLMARADAMVGNSSSGLVEAPSFRLPVINIGTRQDGKIKAGHLIDCAATRPAVAAALARALDPAFRAGLADLVNPYGDGRAGPRIAHILRTVPLDGLLRKKFVDQ